MMTVADLPPVVERDSDLFGLLSALYARRFTGGIWLHFQSGIPKVVEMQTVQIRLTAQVGAHEDLTNVLNLVQSR